MLNSLSVASATASVDDALNEFVDGSAVLMSGILNALSVDVVNEFVDGSGMLNALSVASSAVSVDDAVNVCL